jgi:hypothetical protein
MPDVIPAAQIPEVRKLLHDVNDELSIAVMQLGMMLESGTFATGSRESLEESLEACRKAAEGLKQVWCVLGQRRT